MLCGARPCGIILWSNYNYTETLHTRQLGGTLHGLIKVFKLSTRALTILPREKKLEIIWVIIFRRLPGRIISLEPDREPSVSSGRISKTFWLRKSGSCQELGEKTVILLLSDAHYLHPNGLKTERSDQRPCASLSNVPDVKSPFPINYHPCVQYITVCRVTNTEDWEERGSIEQW